ncbi:efflux transporter outer membrane subunit [Robbsia sp. KACC 23696]|uniref:efflux transporter outer membrane subunit n=1 Tax=Robbsia sp. KACC 23696 TaxID=3149231 RepID=UPI00325B6A77
MADFMFVPRLRTLYRPLLAAMLSVGLAACSFAPTYHAPKMNLPNAFQGNAPAHASQWHPFDADAGKARGAWWLAFDDATLDALEPRVVAANPTVQAAVAHHDASVTTLRVIGASLLPTLGFEGAVDRQRQSDTRPLRGSTQPDEYNDASVKLGVNYDLDLWGRERNRLAAGRAMAGAAADDLAALQLDMQATLANTYFQWRGAAATIGVLDRTIAAYQHALRLTMSRYNGGLATKIDVSRARTQLADAQAQRIDAQGQCDLLRNAMATLVGVTPEQFVLPTVGQSVAATVHTALHVGSAPDDLMRVPLPITPTGLPSTLLQRRPDIAAAERRVAAANADIGVARAAYFPDIGLGLSGGYESDTMANWLAAPNAVWMLGPSVAATIFDGGRRHAEVLGAKIAREQAADRYRATVLKAFQEVDDQVDLEQVLANEAVRVNDMRAAAAQTLVLATVRYRDGASDYLNVVTAQQAALQAEEKARTLRVRQLQAAVSLIQALGGGWQQGALPKPPLAS